MMNDVSLRLKRSALWPPIVVALVYPFAVLGLMAALGISGIEWLFDLDASMGFWLAVLLPALFIFGLLLPTVMLLVAAISMSKHRLVFGPTHLEWRGIPNPWLRRGRIAYEEIESITGAGRSVLCIIPRQGRTRFIGIKAYENGSEIILQELRARVDPSRLEPELEGTLVARARADPWSVFLMVMALVIMLGAMVVLYYDIGGRANVAWTRALRPPLPGRTAAFDLGSDGSLWVLNREGHGDWDQTSNYLVYHVSPGGGGPWRLPTTAELFPEGGNPLGGPESIHVDASGRPWLGFFAEPRLLYWAGDQWRWSVLPEQIRDPLVSEQAWSEGILWIQDLETFALYSINPVTGNTVDFHLGPSGREGYYGLRAAADGSLVALSGGFLGEGPRSFNRFSNGSWGGWRELEFGDFPLPEYWVVSDFTSDREGNLFVLVVPYPECLKGVMRSVVGRWAVDSGEWVWRELQHYGDCERQRGRPALVIDPRGRLWIQTTEAVVVYTESPFDLPPGSSGPVIVYSTENSGYADGSLRLSPDGRVWAVDTIDPLVWIDASAPELPEPLPYWVGRVMGFPGSGSIMMMVALGLNLWSVCRARHALARRKRPSAESGA